MELQSGEALLEARRRLDDRSESPALDAELLLAHVLDCDRAALAARPERPLAAGQWSRFIGLVERRAAGEPVAYLTGRRGFWTLELEVGPGVLVPRPETELLVELALAQLRGVPAPEVLDLGTGSGAIAIAIALERPDAQVCGVDASASALETARRNATAHRTGNLQWLQGSWFEPLAGRRFDLVAANPPYLSDDDPHLAALACEPRSALVAGATGLEAISAICAVAPSHLKPGGALALEHGASQGPEVRHLLADAGFGRPATHRDLAGLERVTLAGISG